MNVFAQFVIFQNLIAAISFRITYKDLKNIQNAQINQLFRFLIFISTYSDVYYGLTRLVRSKNVNNDFRKDSPIRKKQTNKQTQANKLRSN